MFAFGGYTLLFLGMMSSLGRLGFDGDVAWIDRERDTWHMLDHLVA
jgi:hypothetical protein